MKDSTLIAGALAAVYLLSRDDGNGNGDDPPNDDPESVNAAFDYTPREHALDADASPSTGAETYEWLLTSDEAMNWSEETATGQQVTFESLPSGGTNIVDGEIEYIPADYTLTLTVTGPDGGQSSVSETITVPT